MDDDALDRYGARWLVLRGHRLLLNLVECVKTINEASKRGVDTVQVRLPAVREEELRAVRVWTGVDHGKATSPLVLQDGDKLVLKIAAEDTLSTLAGSSGVAA